MQLMTKELEKRFAEVGSQDEKMYSAIVIAKFFTPWSNWTWYATEYDPNDRIFFGYVDGLEPELGRFSLDELESVQGFGGLKVERDIHWKEKTLREVMDEVTRRAHDYDPFKAS